MGYSTGLCAGSHELLYHLIWSCKKGNKCENRCYKILYRGLKRGACYDSRGLIPNRITIEARTSVVNKLQRLEGLEVDLIMGKNHNGALLVMKDRTTLHS